MKKKIKFWIILASGIILVSIITYLLVLLSIKKEEKNHLTIYGNVDIRQVDLGYLEKLQNYFMMKETR